MTYAGRLDKDSEGLLIMTNDGELINSMMRARYHHEKEYHVRVDKEITSEFVRQMSEGVHIQDVEKNLDAVTRPCEVKQIGKYTFSIILTQGLNRQIRRIHRNSARSAVIRSDRRMQYRSEREMVRSKMQGNSCRLLDTE